MRPHLIIAAAALALLGGLASPAFAQTNGPVPGPYGAEDGYNDDGFGWGPAYRRKTNFRPAVGFYNGVERPYPYAEAPAATAPQEATRPHVARRRTATRTARPARRHTASRIARSRSE